MPQHRHSTAVAHWAFGRRTPAPRPFGPRASVIDPLNGFLFELGVSGRKNVLRCRPHRGLLVAGGVEGAPAALLHTVAESWGGRTLSGTRSSGNFLGLGTKIAADPLGADQPTPTGLDLVRSAGLGRIVVNGERCALVEEEPRSFGSCQVRRHTAGLSNISDQQPQPQGMSRRGVWNCPIKLVGGEDVDICPRPSRVLFH